MPDRAKRHLTLLSFRTSNHRSIGEEQEISLVPSSYGRRIHELTSENAVRVAAIYGPNASGKSNLVSAVDFAQDVVRDSFRRWEPGAQIPSQPFLFSDHLPSHPSTYEFEFLLDGERYQYGFSLTSSEIVREWLYSFPLKRRRTLFERDLANEDKFYFGDSLVGANKLVVTQTRDNCLYLSAAYSAKHTTLMPIARALSHSIRFVWPEIDGGRLSFTIDRLREDENTRVAILYLLRAADLGIVDVEVRDEAMAVEEREQVLRIMRAVNDDFDESKITEDTWKRSSIEFKHLSANGDAVGIPFLAESTGTRALIALLGPIFEVLQNGLVIFIDEIDTSLHPKLAVALIELFADKELNQLGAQLIFTSHDTSFLGGLARSEPLLQRDQVWFVEKNEIGESIVYPLTDFSPRKLENLERGYLQGRYGAVPRITDQERRELAAALSN